MKKTYSIVSLLSFDILFSAFSIADYNSIDVTKYRIANPDPLEAIPEKATITLGEKLGKGQTTVYGATAVNSKGKMRDVDNFRLK
ncbi:MAG: hypothetical protein LBR92_04155 [Puniceicoccales bacterium]|jgi:hypothetical protein|nr:hypothetical protein [Puniceicoccales bacterium]